MDQRKKTLSKNLTKLRKDNKLTYVKIGWDLSRSYEGVRSWFNGLRFPSDENLILLADYFNVSKEYLLTDHDTSPAIKDSDLVEIPIIGQIALGTPILAEQNIDDYLPALRKNLPVGENFYLKCKGDSMFPEIRDGDYVLIHSQPEVEDGEIAAVLVNNDTEATLKRVRHDNKVMMLIPENKKYTPLILDEDRPGRVIGKAIKILRDL